VPSIENWSVNDVCEFMVKIGFSECTKLILYNKIDGKAIKDQDDLELFTETLGIRQEIELNKLVYNIDLYK
jgi:hypothetical protein